MSVRRLLRDERGGWFRPDVLIQREHIGKRRFLYGLEQLHCPKIFWAVDSHLNMAWQRWYIRLFDLVLTPHSSLFAALPQEWQSAPAQNFAWPGCRRPWRSHDKRSHSVAFVGVIDNNRPMRRSFAELLRRRCGLEACTLPFDAMLALYDDTRVLPNEAIAHEFNFRIMEGASCGCCVLTPDIGDDLAANFTPGREVIAHRTFKAQASLNSAHDWRAALEYALACLRVYRLEQGLAEAQAAQRLARDAGEDAAFAREAQRHALRLPT
ncbi:MAG: glycosyltransferase family 1 protein [Desulfovibrio sp.]|nr:glycosyltransferase family 1 protein [Desulfovibrio sp.]